MVLKNNTFLITTLTSEANERLPKIQHYLIEPTQWKTFLSDERLVEDELWKPRMVKVIKFPISTENVALKKGKRLVAKEKQGSKRATSSEEQIEGH